MDPQKGDRTSSSLPAGPPARRFDLLPSSHDHRVHRLDRARLSGRAGGGSRLGGAPGAFVEVFMRFSSGFLKVEESELVC